MIEGDLIGLAAGVAKPARGHIIAAALSDKDRRELSDELSC